MSQKPLKIFSRQLARWAEELIASGPFPFRLVESEPKILTARGDEAPDLILWINRESFMAGGILLIPEQEGEETLIRGMACAQALGLRHFSVWGKRDLSIWEDRQGRAEKTESFNLPTDQDLGVANFQQQLLSLMQRLKVLSVTGAVPAEELSSHYFANLCRETLRTASPSLLAAYRMARGEGQLPPSENTPEALEAQKGTLALLRLLALVAEDQLATSVLPERLERAMALAATNLHPPLQEALRPEEDELPLPEEAAIRLHHLFHRLNQLEWRRDRERMAQTVALLLQSLAPSLGGAPLPDAEEPTEEDALLLNPAAPPGNPNLHLATSPAILAALSFYRHLKEGLIAGRGAADLRALQPPQQGYGAIAGTLLEETSLLHAHGLPALAATLRLRWPSRRFSLSGRTPRWVFELLYLLGLAAPGATLHLRTPGPWLTQPFAPAVLQLLQEQFSLLELRQDKGGPVTLRLRRGVNLEDTINLFGPQGERHLPRVDFHQGHPSLLILHLLLPPTTYALLQSGRIKLPVQDARPEGLEREAFLFLHSGLGQSLCRLLGAKGLPPSPQNTLDFCQAAGIPLPASSVLENCRQPWRDLDLAQPPKGALDEELALWLGEGMEPLPSAPKATEGRSRRSGPTPSTRRDLEREVERITFRDGIPRFPEQYLYDLYRPELETFALAGPLQRVGEFFGSVELEAPQGQRFTVEGEDKVRALLLASHCGAQEISLPTDQELLRQILQRFEEDLKHLRQLLVREAHARFPAKRQAERLVLRLWSEQPLPPWHLLEE